MSRRKQARPVRLLDEDGTPSQGNEDVLVSAQPHDDTNNEFSSVLDPNNCGDSSNSGSEEEIVSGVSGGSLPPETHMCPRCHEQFTEMPEFLAHRTLCDNKARRHHEPAHSDPEDMVVSGDEDDEEDCGGKRLEEVRRHRQDAANNNSVGDEDEEEDEDEAGAGAEGQTFPFPVTPAAAGHVTLEALQNTKVAVAQFAATTMANNADNEAALQELAVLQSTLFTLQHQQVFQLQLINQLQRQLSINRTKDDGSPISPPLSEGAASLTPGIPALNIPQPTTSSTPPSPPRIPRVIPLQPRDPSPPLLLSNQPPTSQSLPASKPDNHSILSNENNNSPQISSAPSCLTVSSTTTTPIPTVPTASQPPLCSISSSLASTIITNNDPPPSLDEPNTLEMLQRRAQEVLDNASQGLLASNLADELAFRKGKGSMSPYDSKSGRNEPFFKHRCRYCGKVFGSDSALQIHIRSHTGERPFKCNVCGSRFTTKGNLKVHFQRHTAKFPHIKMNPNPVPEHLDKYHPPLLAQLGPNRPVSPGMPPHPGHPLQFPGGHPFPLYRPPPGPPHDLLPPRSLTSPQRPDGPLRPLPPHPIFIRRDEQDMPENLSKPPQMLRSSPSPPPPPPPPRHDTLVGEPRCKSEPIEDNVQRRDSSSRRNSETHSEDAEIIPKQEPSENEQEIGLESEQSERFRDESPPIVTYDDCSMESKYSNEDMMLGPDSPTEHGLQDQPENLSMRGNTTCNICFKTFACNSALEIHYRSHTKERPFKCSVCDRGFSTKGNMKQHMLTHKIRDMPQHMFDKPSPGNVSGGAGTPSSLTSSGLPQPPLSSASSTGSSKDDSRNSLGNIIHIPERPDLNSSLSNDTMDHRDVVGIGQHHASSLPPPEMPMKATDLGGLMKRSPPETELPLPKRQPTIPLNHKSSPDLDISLNYDKNSFRAMKEMELGMHSMLERVAERVRCSVFAGGVSPIMQQTQTPNPQQSSQPQSQQSSQQSNQSNKHLCHVCNKNFSSSSALQIHMRTHTGDKPFRCTVCQKAFTTKGNLKVHMGTHMWSNGASRRGRRMSLDLPPIPMTPKDSEFLQRRPDLFYPYLPAPFLNGMQQKNPGNGLPSPGKYASLLGFGYPPVSEPLRSQPSSPLSDKPPSSVASSSPPRDPIERAGSVGTGSNNGNGSGSGAGSGAGPGGGRDGREMLPRVWDLHYERQTASEEDVVVSPSNGTINVPTPNQIGVPPPTARGEGLAA